MKILECDLCYFCLFKPFSGKRMPTIISKKPKRHVAGATFILRALNISGSKPPSKVVAGPVINKNPIIIITKEIAIIMKLILLKANFLGAISVSLCFCFLNDIFKA